MIALTVSDLMEGNDAFLRISELERRRKEYGVPDAICIRNDSFTEETFTDIIEACKIWNGDLILESHSVNIVTKALVRCMDKHPMLIGASEYSLDQFCTAAKMFGCRLCLSNDKLESLMDMVMQARVAGVYEIVLDPGIKNMKTCLETCTEIDRLGRIVPEACYPVAVRVWSGEYAMSVGAVALLISDNVVIADDLDADICETLGDFLRSVR